MSEPQLRSTGRVYYREVEPEEPRAGALPVLCLHGFPESSYMWRHLLRSLAADGRRALAPDFPGFGDSPPDPPASWERQVEVLEDFRRALGLERTVLVVHDWGGLIGLRWACEHPDAVGPLVISATGFFPEGRWHGIARTLRTPGEGERLLAALERKGFEELMRSLSSGFSDPDIAEYWKALGSDEGRRATLELYRSGDFEKLEPYRGRLAELGVPALLIWGEQDGFAPLSGSYRFQRELPDSRLVSLPDGGHFPFADSPQRCAKEILAFLGEVER